jgi:hypothetical protein
MFRAARKQFFNLTTSPGRQLVLFSFLSNPRRRFSDIFSQKLKSLSLLQKPTKFIAKTNDGLCSKIYL